MTDVLFLDNKTIRTNMRIITLILLAVGTMLGAGSLSAQSMTLRQRVLDSLSFRSVGPHRGGRVTAVTGLPQSTHVFFMGSTGGGVWKSDDAGQSWHNISDGQIKCGSIGAIAVAPSDPNVIYVGTGSACPRGNVSPGIGLFASTDGGKNWKAAGLPKAGQIGKIVVHPQRPEWLYVAALGNIFGPNPERGVYRSKDGGQQWDRVLFVSDSTGAIDLAMHPHNPRVLLAGMWRAERKPWTLVDGGTQGGIWKSADGGDTWTPCTKGLPKGIIGKIGIAFAPSRPERVYALVQHPDRELGGLYRSDDEGESWTRICADRNLQQRGWYYTHITVDPQNENHLFCPNVEMMESIDGGLSFKPLATPHGDNHGMWVHPHHSDILLLGNDGGASVSLNGGKTWTTQNNQPTAELYRCTVDDAFPMRLYAGQQDNTTISVPSRADENTLTDYESWQQVGGSESADVAVDPFQPDLIWAGSYSGELTRIDRRTGQVRMTSSYPHYSEGTRIKDLKYRWNWNFPIVASRHSPGLVYQAANKVLRTTDGGISWTEASPDLTRQLSQYQQDIPGGPVHHDATSVETYSTIFALEESPQTPGLLWAGSDDGLVHLTRDGGATWTNITPSAMPTEGTVNKIHLSAHHPGRAFMAVQKYRWNDFKPYIFATDDYGQSWRLIGRGIPEGHFVRAIVEDPQRKGLLFAGTEFGLYASWDGGSSWQPCQGNLPITPITDLEIKADQLAISTQGRAFWIFDDLPLLRQLDASSLSKQWLFKPANTYRSNQSDYDADVFFFLGDASADTLQVGLDILDANGSLLRSFATKPDSASRQQPLSVISGLNRFSWDLRLAGPYLVSNFVTFEKPNPCPGPRAIPGSYQVRLRIGTWSQTQPFELKQDPRWTNVSAADYQQWLQENLRVRDRLSEVNQLIDRLRDTRQQALEISRRSTAKPYYPTLKAAADSLAAALVRLEDQLTQNKIEASQDEINYERVLNHHLIHLYSVIERTDDKPTQGMLSRFADLDQTWQGCQQTWERIKTTELQQFQQVCQKNQVPLILLWE